MAALLAVQAMIYTVVIVQPMRKGAGPIAGSVVETSECELAVFSPGGGCAHA